MATTNPNPMYQVDGKTLKYGGEIAQPAVFNVETQLIRGTMSFSKDKLRELDPSYTGFTHIFVLQMPPFMTSIANGYVLANYGTDSIVKAQNHCNNLKALLEMGSTSYSGTPDLALNSTDVNTGWSERSYPAPTYSQYDGKQFTINCLETRYEPLRRGLEYYINGVSDANVKATQLHGAMNADKRTLLDPTLPNITFSIMVVQTDQTLLKLQDVSIWNSCIVSNVDRSNLDWTNGEIDIVQPKSVQFSGVYMPDSGNPAVHKMAMEFMSKRLRLYKRYQDMSAEDIGTASWNTGAY